MITLMKHEIMTYDTITRFLILISLYILDHPNLNLNKLKFSIFLIFKNKENDIKYRCEFNVPFIFGKCIDLYLSN